MFLLKSSITKHLKDSFSEVKLRSK